MNIPIRSANFKLLITTAEQLVREKGCRAATLKDIMERSGLSKGAIYHYVRSKDELLGLVLQESFEAVNQQFMAALSESGVNHNPEEPFQVISRELRNMLHENDVSVRIFIYLLSQMDNPDISNRMRDLYENVVSTSVAWIKTGQQCGAIPNHIDPRKIAEMFVMFSYGMQIRHSISPESTSFTLDDFDMFMHHTLS